MGDHPAVKEEGKAEKHATDNWRQLFPQSKSGTPHSLPEHALYSQVYLQSQRREGPVAEGQKAVNNLSVL